MVVKCPECDFVLSHIHESDSAKQVSKRAICPECDKEFSFSFPDGSRHEHAKELIQRVPDMSFLER